MVNIGIIRCEKNESTCPLTGCFKTLQNLEQGFALYDNAELAGVFTCRCPGDNVVNFAKILKSKGAEAIHFCTCTFAAKKDGKWTSGDGFCDNIDEIIKKTAKEANIPCTKGTAHLPEGYHVESF